MYLYIFCRNSVVFWFCGVVEKLLLLCMGRRDAVGVGAAQRLVVAASTEAAERDDMVMMERWPLWRAFPHRRL
jgi:hypothetical protein